MIRTWEESVTGSSQEASGKITLSTGGRETHDASYGVCIAAQRHCNAFIRGDGAYIPDDFGITMPRKVSRPSKLFTTTTSLCRMQGDRHHPLNRFSLSFKLHAAMNQYLEMTKWVSRVS
jgi:hypothetical protein